MPAALGSEERDVWSLELFLWGEEGGLGWDGIKWDGACVGFCGWEFLSKVGWGWEREGGEEKGGARLGVDEMGT